MRTAFLLCLSVLAGCSGSKPATGGVVLGVSSDFRAGIDLDRLDLTMTSPEGKMQSLTLGPDKGQTNFPLEVPLDDYDAGTQLAMTLQGYLLPNTFVVERKVATTVVADQRRLLRVNLQQQCRFSIGGSMGIQPCPSGQTCVDGVCRDPFVAPDKLEPYDPGWAKYNGDICKPTAAGAPVVTVGEGQSDYKPIKDYDVAQIEAGPQGGYHVWVALRLKNLRRSGSTTTIAGDIPELGDMKLQEMKVIFSFVPDEGGYCKIYGLRYQLALGPQEMVTPMLGKKLHLSATITDKDMAVGKGERWVTLSNDIQ
jgi:hypothetical protein